MSLLTHFEHKALEELDLDLPAFLERTPPPRPGQPETLGDALLWIRWTIEGQGSLVRGRFPTSLDSYLTTVGNRAARYALRLGAFHVPELQRECRVVLDVNLSCSQEQDLAHVAERFLGAHEALSRAHKWVEALRVPPTLQAAAGLGLTLGCLPPPGEKPKLEESASVVPSNSEPPVQLKPVSLEDFEKGTNAQQAIEALLHNRFLVTGKKAEKSLIWKRAGYKDNTLFKAVQAGRPRTPTSVTCIRRAIEEIHHETIRAWQEKGDQALPPSSP